jgi:hypothetical protein
LNAELNGSLMSVVFDREEWETTSSKLLLSLNALKLVGVVVKGKSEEFWVNFCDKAWSFSFLNF